MTNTAVSSLLTAWILPALSHLVTSYLFLYDIHHSNQVVTYLSFHNNRVVKCCRGCCDWQDLITGQQNDTAELRSQGWRSIQKSGYSRELPDHIITIDPSRDQTVLEVEGNQQIVTGSSFNAFYWRNHLVLQKEDNMISMVSWKGRQREITQLPGGRWHTWCVWKDMLVMQHGRNLEFHDLATGKRFTEKLKDLEDPPIYFPLLSHQGLLYVACGKEVRIYH
jgi:hypothetical protein